MKTIITAGLLAITITSFAHADSVRGYTRRDGTYVAPYQRSSPDNRRDNNYGPSNRRRSGYQSPYTRDYDMDGLSNQYDMDDDNDGTYDQYDSNQYGR